MSDLGEAMREQIRAAMRADNLRRERALEDAMVQSWETGEAITVEFPDFIPGRTVRYVVDARAFHKGSA